MGSLSTVCACLSHTLGLLLISLVPTSRLLVAPPLFLAACYYAVRQRIWESSEKAQPWRQAGKIAVLALAKVINFCLIVYFAQKAQIYL